VERFAFHHPVLYRNLLRAGLLLMLLAGLSASTGATRAVAGVAGGIGPDLSKASYLTEQKDKSSKDLGSVVAASASDSRVAVADSDNSPSVAVDGTKDKSLSSRPEGWEGAQALPGKDGSATSAATAPITAAQQQIAAEIGMATGDVRGLGRSLNAVMFGDQHWPALLALWTRESNWNPAARNRSSGACGIPQALPCSKIPDMSPQGQIQWGLQYIKGRYGNPSNAWSFWQSHHWY
jgi:hypothetical protein